MRKPSFHRHQRIWWLLAGFVLACGIILYQTTQAKASEPSNLMTRQQYYVQAASTANKPSVGVPALRVINGISQAQSISNSPIQASEVEQYVGSTYLPYTIHPTIPKVVSVKLMASGTISQMLKGEPTGFPDSKLLWIAEISGDFQYISSGKAPCHHGYEIFDPDTGNLVMARFC